MVEGIWPCHLRVPQNLPYFITKQIFGWCGCNSKLSLWEDDIVNKCPQCGCKHKNLKHLTQCRDPGLVLQLRNSIETIMTVLDKANVASELIDMIEKYLLKQGRHSMVDCTPPTSRFLTIFIDIDNLGWDCFVEGRIPYSLIISIPPMFLRYNPQWSVENWGAKLIQSLLSLTHKQWLYQNSNMHYVSESLTAGQHDELQEKMHGLMRTKHLALLPWHWHFLTIDFVTLGRGPTLAHQVWVANMEMAISVSKVARGIFCTQESLCLLCTPLEAPVSKPPPSSQTRIALSKNVFPHIKLHSTLFAASSHSRIVWLPRTPHNKHCNYNHPSSCSHHL